MAITSQCATDMDYALFLGTHIKHPCVEPSTGRDIRCFYLREAQRALPTLADESARKFLENVIHEYD
ncbi:hypothetical protein HYS47_01315 [Candidatus Woesearchaeota archaeon]|nr:hypothetical protein [Candidatus Woesearchaeota archaeon]